MKYISTIITILFIVSLVCGQPSDFADKIDALAKEVLFEKQTGLSIAVHKDGETIYHQAFGKANLELDVDMHKDNIFRIGSITKQFTSLSILKLAEQGKLDIQDPIQKYLPDYNTEGKTITIEHLLTHTSGIPSYTGAPQWDQEMRKRDFTTIDLINEFATDSLEFDPGTQWKYNNTGYVMLGYIIEKLSGLSYADYIQQHLFKPLGMKSSYYGDVQKIIPLRATGYDRDDEGNLVNSYYLSMTQPHAAGSILSTVSDLAKWNDAVFDYKIVSKESLIKAHTPYTLTDGNSTGYGYGWGIGEKYGKQTIAHGGGINGYLSMGIYYPEEDLYVAVLSNCTCLSPDDLANKIGATVLGIDYEIKEIELTEDELKKFEGQYEIMSSMVLKVFLDEGKLMTQLTGQPAAQIFPSAPNKFFLKVVDAQLEFDVVDDMVQGLTLFQGGQQIKGKLLDN